ncbi:hypothetical protein Tco_1482705 [Tanacetum coccineum]
MMQEQESAKSDEDAATDYEHEKEELRMWLIVVLDEEEIVDLDILSAKADGNTSYHKLLFSMLRKFDRQDLVDLHRLVMKDLKTIFQKVIICCFGGDLKSSYIADGWYFDLLQHVSREKVSSHQGNAREDVELEARS